MLPSSRSPGTPVAAILSGAEAVAAARRVIDRELDRARHITTSSGDATLGQGLAGLALALRCGTPGREAAALRAMIEVVSSAPLDASLFGGFCGPAWVLDACVAHSDPNANDSVDETLVRALEQSPLDYGMDLVHGVSGIGMYALERQATPAGRRLVGIIVDALAAQAESMPQGIAWRRAADSRLPEDRRGDFDLGVAHGQPGPIVFLAGAARAGWSTAAELLAPAVDWLLAQRVHGERFTFPAFVQPGEPAIPARVHAWCYGDVGVSAALHAAGRAVGEPTWMRTALDIARRAARTPPSHAECRDASLCHGSSGVARIFHRLHIETGDDDFEKGARAWFADVLFRAPGNDDDPSASPRWYASSYRGSPTGVGLLEAGAGIVIALAGALGSPGITSWDRLLAIDVPVVD